MKRFPPLLCGIIPVLLFAGALCAEPVVIRGSMVPALLGVPVHCIRVLSSSGTAIPFQVDEVTAAGEYVCPEGLDPNASSADGKLDKQDQIVFLWEDADSCTAAPSAISRGCAVSLSHGSVKKQVFIAADSSIQKSKKSYLSYDARLQLLKTPFYYAQFGKDRFHFTRAGVMNAKSGSYIDLTRELRIEIHLKTLFGLIPLHYTEESMICKVSRYKQGPIRLIRRGDFHLNLGLGLKASRAIVYQMCYPREVEAPIQIHLPVKFSSFFSTAYIEMTPVIRREVRNFSFSIPTMQKTFPLSGPGKIDTLIAMNPGHGFHVGNGSEGFDWITTLQAPDSLFSGSGYVLRSPSKRGGAAECGVHYIVRDLPKGSYTITSRVLFPSAGSENGAPSQPAVITIAGNRYLNGS